jgi:hypothetical protein
MLLLISPECFQSNNHAASQITGQMPTNVMCSKNFILTASLLFSAGAVFSRI